MAKELKEQSEVFFVQVMEPAQVRRSVLECLKQILELLQRFEKFKHIRHEKMSKIQKLRNLMRDANKIMAELKSKLPQTNFRSSAPREPKPAKKIANKKNEAPQAKVPKKERTELERLESELSAIESKLKSFS